MQVVATGFLLILVAFLFMTVWKHHISEHFENGAIPCRNNGAGRYSTVFTNYGEMIDYLRRDGRKWHIAKLRVKRSELVFNMGCEYMASILVARGSREGFKPIELN